MISYHTRAHLERDAAKEEVVGHPVADAMFKREYRAPYQHPFRG